MADTESYRSIVEKGLKSYHHDESLTVAECTVDTIQAGDNYASTTVRVNCTVHSNGKAHNKSVIVKTMPTGDFMNEFVVNQQCFEKEIKMLNDVMPEIEKLLKASEIDGDLTPRLYYYQEDPKLVIMEDQCESKFKVVDMCEGLDLNMCVHVMQTLATFHVASLVLLSKRPDLREFFMKGYWGADNKSTTKFMLDDSLDTLIEKIDSWSNEKWSELLKPIRKRMPDELFALYDAKGDREVPQVLNHVDIKTNNIMFRYRGCGVFDVKLIDLQLCAVRSPVFDLMYFIFTSPVCNIRIAELDTMLRAYHRRWTQTCSMMGYPDTFSFDDLKKEFRRKLMFGFGILYGLYPLVAKNKQDSDQKVFEADAGYYSDREVQQTILRGLAYFKEQELFD